MNVLHFIKTKRTIMLILAFVAVLTSVAVSISAFTDRADRTVTVQTASFDDEGYSIKRTAPEGYFSAGESIAVAITETNNKSKDITSEIAMNANWESPVPDVDPWSNVAITMDGEDISYTVNDDNTISFTITGTLNANSDTQRELIFQLPSDLDATGVLRFTFDQIELNQSSWNAKYDNTDLSELAFGFEVAWNISQSQTTSLGNPNRDVIAFLTDGSKANEYGLQIIKNPYSDDTNTNNGAMMDWPSEGSTPWASYTITDLTIGETVTTIGDNAFAGIPGITSVTLPNTITHIGASAFAGSGLEGELVIPASVTTIESLAFGNLPNVNAITFKHGSDDVLTLPDNESEGKGSSGAFYVSTFLKTTFDFNGNSYAKEYNWAMDNRAKKGISDIDLSYSEIQIGETAAPSVTINPTNHDAYESIQYEIISGSDVIEIDKDTGKVTGTGVGSATIRVTIVDANGSTVQTTAHVTVTAIAIAKVPSQSGSLTYTGSSQSPSWTNYDNSQLNIGGTTSGTNAGSYSVTFTPKTGYQWSDGTTTAKTVSWTIGKAAGSLSVSPATLSINKGSTGTITVTRAGNGTVSATSSDTSIATVSVSGTTVTVTGKAAGTATITISVAAGTNHTAPSNKTVSATVKGIGVDSVALSYPSVSVGGTASPTLKINPSNYDTLQTNARYSVYSGSDYASVGYTTGKVTGKAAGTATIKVTVKDANGTTVTGYCVVTVGTPTADVRYVWNKYSVGTGTAYTDTYHFVEESAAHAYIKVYDGEYLYWSTDMPTLNSETGEMTSPSSYNRRSISYTQTVTLGPSGTVYYLWFEDEDGIYGLIKYDTSDLSSAEASLGFSFVSGANDYYMSYFTYTSISVERTREYYEVDVQGSTSYGYVTSTSSTAYPDDAASGSYWYVYKGSDSIDPTAVSYSTTNPTAGGTVTASVTARANTYGGTIKYLYQYSTDGGQTWTSSGTATTATSKVISVPSTANSFMVRVNVSDNYGFTSANYVYGTNLIIN